MSRLYGLLGYPLTHSFSRPYFKEKFKNEGLHNHDYLVFEEEDVEEFVQKIKSLDNLIGFNITIPHKENIIPFLTNISDEASYVGAVNTVSYNNGEMKGYNTDVIGFQRSIQPLLKNHHSKALILGTGGASKAVKYVMNQEGLASKLVSRSNKGDLSYHEMTPELFDEYHVIINTTPLGTYPNVDSFPNLPYHALTKKHLCFDLVYNPAISAFLELASKQGAVIKNGLEMLHLQAEASWSIWNNQSID